MQINKERLVQTFCEMVSIDSESYHEKKMKDYLMNIFAQFKKIVATRSLNLV